MTPTASWHFPRTDLAKAYLLQLQSGLNAIAIFADRRKGKTEFLLEDLTPLAESRGLRTAYINFWEQRNDPVACVVQGVQRSLDRSGGASRGWKKEVSVKLGALQARLTERDDASPRLASEALYLLTRPKGDLLLMFDEIQHLATSKSYNDLIASLRTFLDSNRRTVRTVFTGSSQGRLNQIFRRQNAAFYNSASLVTFPDMGQEFIDFLLQRFAFLSKRELDGAAAMAAFEGFQRSPFYITDLLQTMLGQGIYDIDAGLDYYRKNNDPDAPFEAVWVGLKAIDRLLLLRLFEDKPLYSEQTYDSLAEELGVPELGQGVVQASLNRLREQGILNNPNRGEWVFESSGLEAWVRRQRHDIEP